MLDFILAALPFAAAGLCIAVVAARFSKGRKTDNSGKRQDDDEKTDYSLGGMCLGMCFGVMFGALGILNLGTCLSLGMLLGLAVGMCAEKKPE